MDESEPLAQALARAAAAEAVAAEYGLALDILGRLAGVTSEDAVADVVLEFAQVMFGAARARLVTLDRWGRAQGAWEVVGTQGLHHVPPPQDCDEASCRELVVDETGLRVPIMVSERPLGRLDIEDLVVPADAGRYGTSVWVIARVTAMALVAARATHGLVPICAGCKSVRDARGTWHPLERWITSTAEVQFSHGLCPTCLVIAEREAGLAPEDDRSA